MSKEWKPGEVAVVEAGCWANRKVALRLAEGWAHENGVNVDSDGIVTNPRPLVVIDPEDREQVERLARAFTVALDSIPYVHDDHGAELIKAGQAALREFANPTPPKPAEPTGLGAVVEDADGVRHVRVFGGSLGATGMSAWLGHVKDDGGERTRRYADIAAVRVLSEGVTQ